MTTPTSLSRRSTGLRIVPVLAACALALSMGSAANAREEATPAPAPSMAAREVSTPDQQVQQVTVDWQGCNELAQSQKNNKKRKFLNRLDSRQEALRAFRQFKRNNKCNGPRESRRAVVAVPGIGTATIICQPNVVQIELYTPNRNKGPGGTETQMWMQKYEVKNNRGVVAVKVPRIYRYANIDDNGQGGTGLRAREGLNQFGNIENFSQGFIKGGLISQRPGRGAPAGDQIQTPVTAFDLNWYWNGFANPEKFQSCKIDAVFTTYLQPRPMGLTWHGDADATANGNANETQSTEIPDLGSVDLACEADTTGSGVGGVRTIAFRPDSTNSTAYYETVTGEGFRENQVVGDKIPRDESTSPTQPFGVFGPLELPQNGSARLKVEVDGVERWFSISSVSKTNDPSTARNLCEISVGQYKPVNSVNPEE